MFGGLNASKAAKEAAAKQQAATNTAIGIQGTTRDSSLEALQGAQDAQQGQLQASLADQKAQIDKAQGLQTANLSPFVDAGKTALGTVSKMAPFAAPTDITEANDPGFQSRLKLGQQVMDRGAAAKGNILTGGTVRAENQAAQDYASNEYDKVFNRALTTYQNAYNNNMGLVNLGQNSATALNSAIGANTGMGVNAVGNNTGLSVNSLGQNLNTGIGVRDLYANSVAGPNGLIIGGGNAQAAGTVGAANAWNQAFNGIGTTAQQLASAGLYGTSSTPITPWPGGIEAPAWSPSQVPPGAVPNGSGYSYPAVPRG